MAGEKILVVDDEAEIVELIHLYLLREGYKVICGDNGQDVLELVQTHCPDLIILDILLPGIDGNEVCRQLRRIVNTPVIFISCRNEDIDIILSLGVGGDDYVTKPFSPSQLVARVKAHLRRNHIIDHQKSEAQILIFPGLEIDLASHIIKVNGRPVTLSAKEFDLLALLAKSPNRVFKIEHLYQMIWSLDSLGDTRTLMVHISNLRKKIESDPADPKYITTVRGVGYKFNAI